LPTNKNIPLGRANLNGLDGAIEAFFLFSGGKNPALIISALISSISAIVVQASIAVSMVRAYSLSFWQRFIWISNICVERFNLSYFL